MEHRWGARQTLDIGIKFHIGSGVPVFGRMLNASSSGAYVATSATLPVTSLIHVVLRSGTHRHNHHHRIAAYVVRADERGVGIEWQEFAPPPVLALIDTLELLPRRSPAASIAVRAATEIRRENEYAPLPLSGCVSCPYQS